MNYVEKVKIKPNRELSKRLNDLTDVSRFAYNFILASTIESFKISKKKPSLKVIREGVKQYRYLVNHSLMCDRNGEVYPDDFQVLLKSAPSQIPDMVCNDIKRAWDTLKKRDTPSFAVKGLKRPSFTIHCKDKTTFKLEDGTLRVSKMEFKLPWKKIRFLKEASDIKRITISKAPYGWYMSILIDIPESTFTLEELDKSIGIDWGVSKFASDSDGYEVDFKKYEAYRNYKKYEKRLKVLQRRLSKKRIVNDKGWKSSNRYTRLKHQVAWHYGKLANNRSAFLHDVSKMYIRENQTIVIEDLKPTNMMKNRKLARSISEAMFYTWKVMLQYKAKFYGREVILVNPKNTSQTCSSCNTKLKEKLTLSKRLFICSNTKCNLEIDRDYNAAINILNKAYAT